MKAQWQSFTPDQEQRFSKWREVKNLISELSTLHYIYMVVYVVGMLYLCGVKTTVYME